MENNKTKKGVHHLLLSMSSLCIIFFMLFSCETKNSTVNLALKMQDNTYVFSKLGTFITKAQLDNNESPSVFSFIQVFDDDGLFVSPDNIGALANTLGGNYELFPYPEKSYDGYFTMSEKSLYSAKYVNRSTDVIGEQIRETTISLSKLNDSTIFEIVYAFNPISMEYTVIKNCEIKSFWITRSIQPGEFTTSSEDFLMINLNDIVNFYDSKMKLELNAEEQLLYIIKN